MDLVMGSGLGMEVASGSISGTNALAGCSSVVGGNTHTWSIGSGSISMMGLGVEFRSMAEDLSSCLGLSRLVRLVQSGVGRQRAAADGICAWELESIVLDDSQGEGGST